MAELLAVALLSGKSGEKAEAVDEAAEVSNRRANGRDPNEAVDGARTEQNSIQQDLIKDGFGDPSFRVHGAREEIRIGRRGKVHEALKLREGHDEGGEGNNGRGGKIILTTQVAATSIFEEGVFRQ
jgi:hypothetical protein